ncbi:hypothetical protein A6E12_18025 [Aliivibrio fischeri]|uniref:YiiX/YebB-like N1pC/P60 family cysteine hydrolase n=1 Tax=Aliivibrio fischeri TaxID=668 RepID=UPI00080E2613|nr:YiiX/YebB-like N1pC/P60 family cysteine hydrolase [Aliivibrio fischeri]OCH24304.1 hypothetical protein A6E12_18025 [Aliivibrio fischeri]
MFLINSDLLRPGDIILTCSDEKPSKTICKLTGSKFSHAMLFVGESSYIHSDLLGVHSGNSQRLLIKNPNYLKVVRIKDESFVTKAIEYARLQVGTSYSKLSAINAGTKLFSKLNTKRQFCSRLVAKSYEYAGLNLVLNSDTCLPQEIADSPLVFDIGNCVHIANKAEIEFALSFDPINHQTEVTNVILKSVKKLIGKKVDSLSDITSYLISDPHFDHAIADIYKNSGYLDMWRYEQKKNPWRYNVALFESLPLTREEMILCATKELRMAENLQKLYENNLQQYFYLKNTYKLKYAEQQFNLYQQLVQNVLSHKYTAESVLKKT